jgi:Pvc16 N-terminal domain
MINTSLEFIKNQLRSFFTNDLGDATTVVELGNIAFFETNQAGTIDDRVVITLVNIEEESTLKNGKSFQRLPDGGIRHIRLPVNLNLYVLLSCNYGGGQDSYIDSLKRLSNIILFFQSQNSFEIQELPDDSGFFKLNFELYTLTFEQINHLWGALGGRQLPSVMYKARLVKIDDRRIGKAAPVIEEVKATDSTPNN